MHIDLMSTTVYFIDNSRQQNWDNLEYWAAAGANLSSTATISQYATSVTVNFQLRIIGNSCPLGACSGRVAWASATIQYGTSAPVTILANNCAIQGNPYFNYSHTLTSDELKQVLNTNNQIVFSIVSCAPTFGTYNLHYELTGTASETLNATTEGQGQITVNVTTPGGAMANIPVSLQDTSSDTDVGTQFTNSKGQAVFTGLNIGDSYTATVNYSPFSPVSQSTELNGPSGTINISLSCPSGTTYGTTLFGQPQCTSNTVGTINTGLMEFLPVIIIVGGIVIGGLIAWGWAISEPEREAGIAAKEAVSGITNSLTERLKSGTKSLINKVTGKTGE